MSDDDLQPLLGRSRTVRSGRDQRYLGQVLAAASQPWREAGGRRNARFDGSRIGRGAGVARLLGSSGRRSRARRAVVKTRLVRLGGKGAAAARAHLRYIQRDGVQRDGAPGVLYSADCDKADGKAFLQRCGGDRNQFRLIVSPEDGDAYDDLKPLVRRFIARMEEDLGTRLDWVAVDHTDTAHPHSHVVLRGKDDRDRNLVIAREYISRGMRERVAEIVTLDLGPRQDFEIRQSLRREVAAERLTSIDRALVREADGSRAVSTAHCDPFRHSLRAGRLRKLQTMGLAEPLGGGRWRLADAMDEQLRRIGERGDIVRTMQRALGARCIARAPGDRVIHDHVPPNGVVGRLVARGLLDEISDRHFLIIDGLDGRAHHLDIGSGDSVEPLPENCIVGVRPRPIEARASDRTVAGIAAANDGRYSLDLHLAHDPEASEEFVRAHVRRLEAIRRGGGEVERLGDGSWRIGADHLDQASAYERRQARASPAHVELLSPVRLEALIECEGATWLDRRLLAGSPEPLRDAGFGREVGTALALRRRWLLAQGLAEDIEGALVIKPGALAALQKRELSAVAARISRELGSPYVPVSIGNRVSGTLSRRLDLASGRFALVDNGRDFTLVPWRPALERQLGKAVAGILRPDGISWSRARGRDGPTIS